MKLLDLRLYILLAKKYQAAIKGIAPFENGGMHSALDSLGLTRLFRLRSTQTFR